MIIDKDKRFIFVHNPRTGGTSIRKVIEEYQDHEIYKKVDDALSETNFKNVSFSHTDHCSADLVPNIQDYGYVFTCVRNPFSRTYSYYQKISTAADIESRKLGYANFSDMIKGTPAHALHAAAGGDPPTFDAIVGEMYDMWSSPNPAYRYDSMLVYPYDFWTDGAAEVIRFEDLQNIDTWNQLIHKCGIDDNVPRPHENRACQDPFEYRDHYTDSMKKKIHRIFQKEIETYGYEF